MKPTRYEMRVLAEMGELGKHATFGNLHQILLLEPRIRIVMDPYPLKTLRVYWPVGSLRLNIAVANLKDGKYIVEVEPKPDTALEWVASFLPHSKHSRMHRRYRVQPHGWHLLELMASSDA